MGTRPIFESDFDCLTEMFSIESSKCFNIRKTLVYNYQEQGSDQNVLLVCLDGEHRCNEIVLQFVSDYFDHQLAARKRMGNELVFTFPYSKLCIKSVVDLMHGINVDSIDLVTLLEIMKFLNYENKVSSQFEKNVIEMLETKLTEA